MRKISSFTLTELIIVLIVLAILVAVGIPIYQYATEKQKIEICTANLEAILEALKMYELDNDAFPDSLAKAWQGYGDRALAVVWERKKKEGNYTYLAYMSFKRLKYFLANIFSLKPAYASFSDFCADTSMLKCPADDTPFDGAGNISYGLHNSARNRSWEWISDHIGANEPFVADSEYKFFGSGSGLTARHRKGLTREAVAVDREGNSHIWNTKAIAAQQRCEEEERERLRDLIGEKGTVTPIPGKGTSGTGKHQDVLGNLVGPQQPQQPQKGGGGKGGGGMGGKGG